MTTISNRMSLKPSLLVSLRTTVKGGVSYQRLDLETGLPVEDGADVSKWETTRVIEDKAEYERAKKARSKVSSLLRGACVQSAFGLLCLSGKETALDEAYNTALAIVDAHNATATVTNISVYLIKGRIEGSDEMAAAAIGVEMRDLIDDMKRALEKADVAAIREAASKAKQLGTMLDSETAEKVGRAVEEARSAARTIVKRIETDGEDAGLVIQELSRKALNEARFAFLDLDTPKGATEGGGSSTPPVAHALDLDDVLDPEGEKRAAIIQARNPREMDVR